VAELAFNGAALLIYWKYVAKPKCFSTKRRILLPKVGEPDPWVGWCPDLLLNLLKVIPRIGRHDNCFKICCKVFVTGCPLGKCFELLGLSIKIALISLTRKQDEVSHFF